MASSREKKLKASGSYARAIFSTPGLPRDTTSLMRATRSDDGVQRERTGH
jgi:hypothetical protein